MPNGGNMVLKRTVFSFFVDTTSADIIQNDSGGLTVSLKTFLKVTPRRRRRRLRASGNCQGRLNS